MMLQKEHLLMLKRSMAKFLAFATIFNTTLLTNLLPTPTVKAQELTGAQAVFLSEVFPTGNDDTVELFTSDTSLIGEQLDEGWKLTNLINSKSADLSLLAAEQVFNEYGLLTINTGNIFGVGEGVLVLSFQDETKDTVSWGNKTSAQLPARTDTGKSLSYHLDLGWFSNTSETLGAPNSFPEQLPSVPSEPVVLAGEQNATGIVNSFSHGAVNAQVAVEGAQSATIRFFDVAVDPIGDTNNVSEGKVSVVKDLSEFADGEIAMRSFSRAGGVYSAWGMVGFATKDTVAPEAVVLGEDFEEGKTVYTKQNPVVITGSAELGSTVTFYTRNGDEIIEEVAVVDGSDSLSASLQLEHLNEGVNDFAVVAQDAAGNKSGTVYTAMFIYDNIAPDAPYGVVADHNFGEATVSLEWDFDLPEECAECTEAPVAGFNVYSSQNGEFDASSKIGSVSADKMEFTASALGAGWRHFAVTAFDAAGNESAYSSEVSVLVAGLKSQKTATPSENVVFGPQGLSFTPADSAVGDSVFTVVGYDNNLPAGKVPKGIAFVGNYFDVEVDNDTAFPVNIKFYYTDAQLAASGLKESQLQGIYFYDEATDSWMLYGDTGVNTADIEDTDYSGYVWANADHFTPIAIGGDNTPPEDVAGFQASSGNQAISLSWNKVAEDAVGYIIYHRPATNKSDSVPYTESYVSGSSKISTVISDLQNGIAYEFRIWAVDAVGNKSETDSVVFQTPGEQETDDLVLPTKKPADKSVSSDKNSGQGGVTDDNTCCIGGPVTQELPGSNNGTEQLSDNQDEDKDNDDKGQVSGDRDEEDSNKTASESRALVTFLIIVAAGAAGFGGYYAYQWWVDRPREKAEVVVKEKTVTNKKQKKSRRNRRW